MERRGAENRRKKLKKTTNKRKMLWVAGVLPLLIMTRHGKHRRVFHCAGCCVISGEWRGGAQVAFVTAVDSWMTTPVPYLPAASHSALE